MDKRTPDIQRRCRLLKAGTNGNGPVVYWMSREQRAGDNWALLHAQEEARLHHRPLVVAFCLITNYPGANLRHYAFMLKPFTELHDRLARHRIPLFILKGSPPDSLSSFVRDIDAHSLTTDFDPLRIKRDWKNKVLKNISIPAWEVDAHNIIPAWVVSDKKEYGAYTIRPKINRLIADYLTDIPALTIHPVAPQTYTAIPDIRTLLSTVPDTSVTEVKDCIPGEKAAAETVAEAITHRLPGYSDHASDPCRNSQSHLSPYLHFGHFSPQRLAWRVSHSDLPKPDKEAFLEQLIVRRELADNFCHYEPAYDSVDAFTPWARKTLEDHLPDQREYTYTIEEWDQAQTHDHLWNACQRELVNCGQTPWLLADVLGKKNP